MSFAPYFAEQIAIQEHAIRTAKTWAATLVGGGLIMFIVAQVFPWQGGLGGTIASLGSTFIGSLATLPYKEIAPKRERMAAYRHLLQQFEHFDELTEAAQQQLMTIATDALKEAMKR